MAKVLQNIFISSVDEIAQTYIIESWHVSQSVDALTATTDYDISISGSLNLTGSMTNGDGTPVASGQYSHAEGSLTIASGDHSHAEGYNTIASGSYSHAEGYGTNASGSYSHAEGRETVSYGVYSHAEGINTIASGDYSHAEGQSTKASGS